MTRKHELKIYKPYADAIVDGSKTFEVRLNDRGYNAGDTIVFEVIDKCQIPYLTHPLQGKKYRIDYVHSGLGMEKDYVVFSIKPYGRWIAGYDSARKDWPDRWVCSECGTAFDTADYNYCPNCGALMDQEVDDEID